MGLSLLFTTTQIGITLIQANTKHLILEFFFTKLVFKDGFSIVSTSKRIDDINDFTALIALIKKTKRKLDIVLTNAKKDSLTINIDLEDSRYLPVTAMSVKCVNPENQSDLIDHVRELYDQSVKACCSNAL